jgi:hypothetical protein
VPFKSKAQQRFMFAAEERGDVKKGTAKKWAEHTKNIKRLPEHVKEGSLKLIVQSISNPESIKRLSYLLK